MSYFDNYTSEEIENIVANSVSYKDFARKIGYSNSPSGDTIKNIKRWLEPYDTTHFTANPVPTKRTVENIFIEKSTASQHTLRAWYLKGGYSPYYCSICGQEAEWQNKPLALILDHINGINNDDRLENLRWVCPNCNQQLETTGSRNPNRKVFEKKYYCCDCGKEISKGSTRCEKCYSLTQIVPLEEMPITREELKEMIRILPFTYIGQEYQVSDNAVRKWCVKFGLPKTKKEINSYSDEEWDKI
jgi:hypothetical protein